MKNFKKLVSSLLCGVILISLVTFNTVAVSTTQKNDFSSIISTLPTDISSIVPTLPTDISSIVPTDFDITQYLPLLESMGIVTVNDILAYIPMLGLLGIDIPKEIMQIINEFTAVNADNQELLNTSIKDVLNAYTTSEKQPLSIKDVMIDGIKDRVYTGKKLSQKPIIANGETTLIKGTDYKLSYKNNTEIGTATIKITGIGTYSGTISKSFKIVPPAPIIKTVTAKSPTNIYIEWDKSLNASGYQIYIKTENSDKYIKTATIKDTNTIKYTIKSSEKVEKIKIRAYTIADKKAIYSAYNTKTINK